jgi:hypothetical protein
MDLGNFIFACVSATGTLVAIGMSLYSIAASKRGRAEGKAMGDQKVADQIGQIDERTRDIKANMSVQDGKIDVLSVKVGRIEGKLGITEAAPGSDPPLRKTLF